VDVLTDLLQRSRARGAAFSHSTVRGAWGIAFPPTAGIAVHGIVDGETHLGSDDAARARRVLPGDLVLVRGSLAHHMAHEPGGACRPFTDVAATGSPSATREVRIDDRGDGPGAVFFCGAYRFEGDLCAPLLAGLPDVIHLRPQVGSSLRATMDILAGELLQPAPGQQALLDRLLDVALVQVLRRHFAADVEAAPAWFRALDDPAIGAALRAVHADPQRPWTVAELASEAALSRATFARRFTHLLGVAPLAYLTDWRMALAREQLRDTDAGLAAIARSLGYASEFSFAAAFKRHEGVAPGRWRASAQRARPARTTFAGSGLSARSPWL
jgi:AraC-like DNA-binding protein